MARKSGITVSGIPKPAEKTHLLYKTSAAGYLEVVLSLYDSFLVYTDFETSRDQLLEDAGIVVSYDINSGSTAECGRDGTGRTVIYVVFF